MLNPSVVLQTGLRTLTGVTLRLVPGSQAFGVKIDRAPDSGGTPNLGQIVTIWQGPPIPVAGIFYDDPHPLGSGPFWYRAYHWAPGYTDGTPTSWVEGVVSAYSDGHVYGRRAPAVFPVRRDLPMADTLYPAAATDSQGAIFPAVNVQTDGAQSRVLAKGVVSGAGTGGTVSRDSGTATAGTATTLSDTTKAWTTNQWAGGWVTITGGTGSGQVAQVASNTATALTIVGTWTAPNNTSTYVVTRWVDGAAVTFPVTYQNSPQVVVREGLGISQEPRAAQWTGAGVNAYSASAPSYDQTFAVNVSASGFVLRSRLMQKITGAIYTNQGNDFGVGNALTTVGGSTIVTLASAPAYNDQYTVNWTVTVSWDTQNKGLVQGVTVAIDTDPTGTNNWTQQYTQTFQWTPTAGVSGSHLWGDGAAALNVSGFTSSGRVRIRVTAASGEQSFSVHGDDMTDDSQHGVTYTTSSTPQEQIFASKTPDAGDSVAWEALVTT